MNRMLERSIRVAEAYLQTALIVDDRAWLGDAYKPPSKLVTPGRQAVGATDAAEAETIADELRHNLDVKLLFDAFAERGIICGVITPVPGAAVTATTVRAAERADIVLLDWQINDDDGRTALSIITELIRKDDGERLRLIAIFTGEQKLTEIGKKIDEALGAIGKVPVFDNDKSVDLTVRHTRIAIFSKSPLSGDLADRAVTEADLPHRVISDFATMTNGLVPAIALTALAALRTNASRILDKYHAGMDAPFLAHCACLPNPDDASRHLAAAIAAEAGCVMESAVFAQNPASIDAMMDWIAMSRGEAPELAFAPDRKLNRDQIRVLFEGGFECTKPSLSRSMAGDRGRLSSVIAGRDDETHSLDLELAWLMSFRTVYDDSPPPVLRLGTVVRKRIATGEAPLYICMRPRCDCVRLDGAEHFQFLPLVEPAKDKNIHLSVRLPPATYRQLVAGTKSPVWLLETFAPVTKGGPVTARRDAATGSYCFTTSDEPGVIYDWIGELKPEFAQRIAYQLAAQLSRVAVNNTEWLRRQEGLSD